MASNQIHHIALAADSFLYAPLFIAREAGYFGEHSIEFGAIKAPTDDTAHRDAHLSAIYRLLGASQPPLFVACDPVHAILVSLQGDAFARIAGVFTTKPAAWLLAYNDVKTRLLRKDVGEVKILTHPAGMSADILTRLYLLRQGYDAETIDQLVTNQKSPKDELKTDARLSGLVTTELIDVLCMKGPNISDRMIFAKLSEVLKIEYPMSGLVIPRYSEATEKVRRHVLVGISLALKLAKEERHLALGLLRSHYSKRSNNVQEWHNGIVPLKPLSDLEFSRLEDAWLMLHSEGIYPDSLKTGEDGLKDLLETAWATHLEVLHSGTAKKGAGATDPPDDFSTYLDDLAQDPDWELASQIYALGPPADILFGLDRKRLERNLAFLRANPRAKQLIALLNGCGGTFELSRYHVLGSERSKCVCFDRDQRLSLRHSLVGAVEAFLQGPHQPTSVEFVGPQGGGKSTLSEDLREYLLDKGIPTILSENTTKLASPDEFQSNLVSALKDHIAHCRACGKEFSAAIFIDEVDKTTTNGSRLYSTLLPWLETAGGTEFVNIEGEQFARRNLFWIFASVHGPTVEDAKAELGRRAANGVTGAKDYATRIKNWLSVKVDNTDPRARAAVCAAKLLELAGRGAELTVEPAALFALAVYSEADGYRELASRVEWAYLRLHGATRMSLHHVLEPEQLWLFRAIYREALETLGPLEPLLISNKPVAPVAELTALAP